MQGRKGDLAGTDHKQDLRNLTGDTQHPFVEFRLDIPAHDDIVRDEVRKVNAAIVKVLQDEQHIVQHDELFYQEPGRYLANLSFLRECLAGSILREKAPVHLKEGRELLERMSASFNLRITDAMEEVSEAILTAEENRDPAPLADSIAKYRVLLQKSHIGGRIEEAEKLLRRLQRRDDADDDAAGLGGGLGGGVVDLMSPNPTKQPATTNTSTPGNPVTPLTDIDTQETPVLDS